MKCGRSIARLSGPVCSKRLAFPVQVCWLVQRKPYTTFLTRAAPRFQITIRLSTNLIHASENLSEKFKKALSPHRGWSDRGQASDHPPIKTAVPKAANNSTEAESSKSESSIVLISQKCYTFSIAL